MKSTGALSGQYTAASSRRLYEAIKAMGLFKKLVVDKETDVLDLKRAEQEWLRQAAEDDDGSGMIEEAASASAYAFSPATKVTEGEGAWGVGRGACLY